MLQQTLTLGDLQDECESVRRRLELIAELASSIRNDFDEALVLPGTQEDALGAGRGVLSHGR